MRILVIAILLVPLTNVFVLGDDESVKMAAKLVEEAGTAFQMGKTNEAIDLAAKAIKLDPKKPAPHFVLGTALFSKQQYEGAAKEFREVLKLNPSFDAAYFRLGETCLKLRKNEDAVSAFREAIRLNPKFAKAHDR